MPSRQRTEIFKRGLEGGYTDLDSWDAVEAIASRAINTFHSGGRGGLGRTRPTVRRRGTTAAPCAAAIDAPAFPIEIANEVARDFEESLYLTAKRSLDIVVSCAAIILLAPLMLAAAALVKLTDWGPVLYRHARVGKDGREFNCYKFRSMVRDAERLKDQVLQLNSHNDHRTFKAPDDPRITRVGRWLRRLSIDELPQLLNVLQGDMSLVGPRPPVPAEVERYAFKDMERLSVKPGLTCIWQVSGRSRLAFPEQLQLDLEYIANRSLWLDVTLLAKTIPAVLSADGAY